MEGEKGNPLAVENDFSLHLKSPSIGGYYSFL